MQSSPLGKEVTRTRLPQSLHGLSSSQVRVYPPCFNLIYPTTNISLKNSCHFVPQLKSTICFHFKCTNIKCEGWGLITVMRFPTMMICSSKQGLLRTQIWMHTMFWFLWILTWSWTWTYNEDLWGLWSGSTHTWIFSLRHQQMLVVLLLPSITILNRQTPRSFLSSSNPKGWTTRGSDNGAYQSSCTAARSLFPGNVGGPTGECRAIIYHTKFLENRGTKWNKQNKRRAKRGQASTQAPVF